MFYLNNCFDRTIIKLNEKKIDFLQNAKSDIFLYKTFVSNIILL